MKNKYRTNGDITIIYLTVNGKVINQCLIDTDDLEKVKSIQGSWRAHWTPSDNKYRVVTQIRQNSKRTQLFIHRYIMEPPKNKVIDHFNGNPLDNRRCNLRTATQSQNMQNRIGPASHNRSRTRGVTWTGYKWLAKLTIEGEVIEVGRYDNYRVAVHEISKARSEYMPYSKEAAYKK